jgi:hypothetical protein
VLQRPICRNHEYHLAKARDNLAFAFWGDLTEAVLCLARVACSPWPGIGGCGTYAELLAYELREELQQIRFVQNASNSGILTSIAARPGKLTRESKMRLWDSDTTGC